MSIVISYVIYTSLTFGLSMDDIMSLDVALHRLFEEVIDSTSGSGLKSEKKEESRRECPYYFGYLTEYDKEVSFPEECLVCSRVIDCILLPLVNLNPYNLVNELEENKNEQNRLIPIFLK